MAIGRNQTKLSEQDRQRVAHAVEKTEAECGLQILVYFGRAKGNPREAALAELNKLGFQRSPGVFLLVEPKQHSIEVITSEHARARISDSACEEVIACMVPELRNENWAAAIETALAEIVKHAGRGEECAEDELPDILGDS